MLVAITPNLLLCLLTTVSIFSKHTTTAIVSKTLTFVFVRINFIISILRNIVIQLSRIANQPVNKSQPGYTQTTAIGLFGTIYLEGGGGAGVAWLSYASNFRQYLKLVL